MAHPNVRTGTRRKRVRCGRNGKRPVTWPAEDRSTNARLDSTSPGVAVSAQLRCQAHDMKGLGVGEAAWRALQASEPIASASRSGTNSTAGGLIELCCSGGARPPSGTLIFVTPLAERPRPSPRKPHDAIE